MQLHKLQQNSKVFADLQITEPTIISIIPDFEINVHTLAKLTGVRVSNSLGLVVGQQSARVLGKLFSGIKHFKTQREHFAREKEGVKKIHIYKDDVPRIEKNQYIFYDHTVLTQATKLVYSKQTGKKALEYLFESLKKIHKEIKVKHPAVKHELLFLFDPKLGENSLFELLKVLILFPESKLNQMFNSFDNFVLGRVIGKEEQGAITPLMTYDEKGQIRIQRANINYIKTYFESSNVDPVSVESKGKPDKQIKSKDVVNRVIAGKNLDKTLNSLNIKDKSTLENIKIALSKYKPKTKDDATLQILKAVNQSIHGTDEIDDKYINNPSKLFDKLDETNTYSKEINIPKINNNRVVQPSDIIDFHQVSSLVRKQYEFKSEGNIHNTVKDLFRTLSTQKNHPVDLVKLEHQYDDDNINRTITYTATLKNKDPVGPAYKVKVKVPALVNDRYFKLNGKNYIMSNQLMVMPITKTAPYEVRLITNYATATLSVVNLRFNIDQLSELLNYINIKYSDIVKSSEKDSKDVIVKMEFKDGTIVDLNSLEPYRALNELIVRDEDTENWVVRNLIENVDEPLPGGINEFLYERIVMTVQTMYPKEEFKSKPKAVPYIRVHIGGEKIPFIVYLWQQIGLFQALVKVEADFSIGTEPDSKPVQISLPLEENKNLYIYKSTERARLVTNGLLMANKKALHLTSTNIDDKQTIMSYIQEKYGSRTVGLLDRMTENIIDTITKDLLKFNNLPIDFIELSSNTMLYKLLNDKPSNLADLNIHRSRQAEIIFNILYKEILIAHSDYSARVEFGGKDAKVFLVED